MSVKRYMPQHDSHGAYLRIYGNDVGPVVHAQPVVLASDHDAEIAARDARIAELERDRDEYKAIAYNKTQEKLIAALEAERDYWRDNRLGIEGLLGRVQAERDALQQRLANALTDLKAIRGELIGIGKESSHEFHRIGVESALGMVRRAIDAQLAPVGGASDDITTTHNGS